MPATHDSDSTKTDPRTLYLAFELGWTTWNLAFTTGMGQKPRLRSIRARDLDALKIEIQRARQRFGLAEEIPVVSCFEAGRDGFWVHRHLKTQGVDNIVVDAASIEVNRRAKSDGLDVAKRLSRSMTAPSRRSHQPASTLRLRLNPESLEESTRIRLTCGCDDERVRQSSLPPEDGEPGEGLGAWRVRPEWTNSLKTKKISHSGLTSAASWKAGSRPEI